VVAVHGEKSSDAGSGRKTWVRFIESLVDLLSDGGSKSGFA
jgi:hypothetical protein